MSGENDFIDWLTARQKTSPRVIAPAGDDLAILNVADDQQIVVGTDQVLDGVHFDGRVHAPRAIGRKAMNRNLSDCAAMACWPMSATVTLALPRGRAIDFAKEIYLGIEEAGAAFECPIVGGDTGSWDGPLAVTVTILGRTVDGRPPIRRSGARAGDRLWVSGPLGGSWAARHIHITPRVREAQMLAGSDRVSAMIDISDGLSRDVVHLCRQSEVGVEIDAAAVPIHADVATLAGSPLEHALNDGEDYELLFAADARFEGPGVAIGRFIAEPGVWLLVDDRRELLKPGGWEHRW